MKRTEEEKIAAGQLFCPGDPALREKKKKAHHLNGEYNRTEEEEVEKRQAILSDLLGKMGENCFLQGPIFFHYGCHTRIGDRFFANFHLTIQDDAEVSIGNDCNFGPNVTIVTPIHPMLPQERKLMQDAEGKPVRLCYAKPVKIGNDCWLCANVTVCSGVTIGDGCVIGAGSVVTRDIPAGYFAAGNPARIIRKLTEADSMVHLPQILADNQVIASFSQEAGENGSDR